MEILHRITHKTMEHGRMEDTFVRAHGLKVRIRRRPVEGQTPLLLINGLGGCLEAWEPLTRMLPGRDIIAIDHPGTGLSSAPNYVMSMLELALFYVEVLEIYDIEKVDVLGFSFGGTIAQEIVNSFPWVVNSLLLVASAPGRGGFPADPLTIMLAANPMRYQIPLVRELSAPMVYKGRAGRDPSLFKNELAGWYAQRPTMLGVAAQVAAFSSWSSMPWLASIEVPTLVLAGGDDPMAPASNSTLMASIITGSELHILDRAGHLFLFDEPETSSNLITGFLDRIHADD